MPNVRFLISARQLTRRVAAITAGALFIALFSGCCMSQAWYGNGTSTISGPYSVKGLIHSSSADPSTRVDALILTYYSPSRIFFGPAEGASFDYALICPRGQIPEEFLYRGSAKMVEAIFQDLGSARIDAMANFRFDSASAALAKDLETNPQYSQAPLRFSTQSIPVTNERIIVAQDKTDRIALIPFVDKPNDPLPGFEWKWYYSNNIEQSGRYLSQNARVLVFPANQPRPRTDRVKRICISILQTPFALIGDILTAPFQITGWGMPNY